MGYWSQVNAVMNYGVKRETAEVLVAELKYGNKTKAEKEKLIAKAELEVKLRKTGLS